MMITELKYLHISSIILLKQISLLNQKTGDCLPLGKDNISQAGMPVYHPSHLTPHTSHLIPHTSQMFFVVSKILKVFIFPLTWIIIFLVLAYFIKDKKWRRGLFISAIALLLLFSDNPLLQWSQYMTTRHYSHQKLPKQYYNVAIVMGGFSNGFDTATMQPNYIENRGVRLWEAIHLYESGVAEKILITGDASISIDRDGESTDDAMKLYLSDFGIHDDDLILEQHARNTVENATYSIAILDSLGVKHDSCILITSASHMKRSLKSFSTQGWPINGYAVNIYPKPHPNAYQFIPSWKTLTDWNELLNEWVGGVVYKVTGK